MTSSCVVLGGGGFLGAHIAERLAADGLRVRAFGRRSPARPLPDRVEWYQGDFTDETSMASAIEGFETVIHLIHATFPSTANAEIAADIQRSVIPTVRLLEACVKFGVKRLIFFSSGGTVYGPDVQIPIVEDSPTHPISAYGVAKLAIENYMRFFQHAFSLNGYVVRLANPYGPWQMGTRNQGLIAVAGRRIFNGEEVVIYGDGSTRRDYVYVDDVADFTSCLIRYSGSQRVFNVGGGGNGKSVADVIEAVQETLKKKAVIRLMPARSFDVPSNVLSIERAKTELGWSPKASFLEGLEKTLKWQSTEF